MFDTYVTGSTEYVPYEKTVTHQYATTTEQSRHLDELREQARRDVLKGYLVEIGAGRVHMARHRDEMLAQDCLDLTFVHDGKTRRERIDIPDKFVNADPTSWAVLVRDRLAYILADEMMVRVIAAGRGTCT